MDPYHVINLMLGNYKMQKALGHGCYGYVFKCVKCDTKEAVAVKILRKRGESLSKIREVRFSIITVQRSHFSKPNHYKNASKGTRTVDDIAVSNLSFIPRCSYWKNSDVWTLIRLVS